MSTSSPLFSRGSSAPVSYFEVETDHGVSIMGLSEADLRDLHPTEWAPRDLKEHIDERGWLLGWDCREEGGGLKYRGRRFIAARNVVSISARCDGDGETLPLAA